jgi:hypothetical protein
MKYVLSCFCVVQHKLIKLAKDRFPAAPASDDTVLLYLSLLHECSREGSHSLPRTEHIMDLFCVLFVPAKHDWSGFFQWVVMVAVLGSPGFTWS